MKKFLNEFMSSSIRKCDGSWVVSSSVCIQIHCRLLCNDIIKPINRYCILVDFSQVVIHLGENVTLNSETLFQVITLSMGCPVLLVKMVTEWGKDGKTEVEEAPAEPFKSDELKALEQICRTSEGISSKNILYMAVSNAIFICFWYNCRNKEIECLKKNWNAGIQILCG